jgi:hypothetical protein
MADILPVKSVGDYRRGMAIESGKNYRVQSQDLGPAIRRVQSIREGQEQSTRASNPNEWRHKASIPVTVLVDWLKKNNFDMHQWAVNEGGIPGRSYPYSRSGVKDKFLAYFLSRDFSKLHNEHITTKRETQQFVVPELRGNHGTEHKKGS